MPAKKRLAIVATHPVQYHSPLFQCLTNRNNVDVKVFYTWSQWQESKVDAGFGKVVEWDIPLLQGYEYEFVENISANPGINHFRGLINPSLLPKIHDWKSDVVLVFGWNYWSHLNIMIRLKGSTPVFFRGDSHLLNSAPIYKKVLRKAWLTLLYRFVDKAFYVGQNNMDYFKAFGLKNEQLVFAPHAIDNGRFSSANSLKENIFRDRYGLRQQHIVLLFAGKFEQNKDPETLIKAFLSLNNNKTRLLMVGNGVLENYLKEICKCDSRIQFLDFQNQSLMPSLYAAADVLVLPSQSETWGLVINEAMAAGIAIVASDKVGCSKDLVNDGLNGYVFPAGNVKALRTALEKITQDKNKVLKMGANSANLINEWSYEKIARAIESQF